MNILNNSLSRYSKQLETFINDIANKINYKYGLIIKINPYFKNNIFSFHGYIDYLCFINNLFFGIEAKETWNKKNFFFNKFSQKQLKTLKYISTIASSFVIFYIYSRNKIILINYNKIAIFIKEKKVSIDFIIKEGCELNHNIKAKEFILLFNNLI